MIKFALLASGSKGNCCIIKSEDSNIVIDCGSTKRYLSECFQQLQYDYKNCDALFVTHTHTDHIAQLKMFDDVKTYAKCELETNHFHKIDSLDEIKVSETLKVTELPLSHDSKACSGWICESENSKLVYITDTGYIKEDYLKMIENADYYIFESNHDIEMLMQTKRPMYVKQRILGDLGHLCNEDSAHVLSRVIGDNTKEVVLAHISEEGNSKEKAKQVLVKTLMNKNINVDKIKITAASQFQIVIGGEKF